MEYAFGFLQIDEEEWRHDALLVTQDRSMDKLF